MPQVAFEALGCKVNQYDSEAMAALFRRRGYEVVPFSQVADVYVIETCTVTHVADRKSRRLIRRAHRLNPGAVIVAAGCYAQTSPGEVAGLPGVGVVLGNTDRAHVVDLVEEARRRAASVVATGNVFRARTFEEMEIDGYRERTRAAVKVQDGCNAFCTFCIVPYARGGPRSRDPEAVCREVERLVGAGFREVILTGVHLGAYGREFPGRRPDLTELVRLVGTVPGVERLRLSSVEPMDVTRGLVEALAELPAACHHLHLPVQSGSDAVLARMRRRYTARYTLEISRYARQCMPDLGLSADVMAGFPGESEEDFQATRRLLEEAGFTRLHVFPYSPRRGTAAASFPDQVPYAVKDRRVRELIDLGDCLAEAFHRRWAGREVEVLVEEDVNGELSGYTRNYVRVSFAGPAEWLHRTVRVFVTGADAEGARGVARGPNGSAWVA